MALTSAQTVRLGKAVSGEGGWNEGGGEEGSEAAAGEWFPSPERVVWEWPRLNERLVEDPD